MADVIVIGGGVIGLSAAYELAGQGATVHVLDQGPIGREASWAGAGILPPGNAEFSLSPGQRLRSLSHSRWADLSEELRETTGIDNGYRVSGGIELRLKGRADQLNDEIASWRAEGIAVSDASIEDARRLEPRIHPEAAAGYRLPELGQVRNPRHLKALAAGCAARGVRFSPGTLVWGFDRSAEKIVGVKTPAGIVHAGTFCVCAGAWSASLAEAVHLKIPVKPVRGQIVLLNAEPLPFSHVLQTGPRYLVPRCDGRILVGSTEEDAGFEKKNTAGGVAGLIRFAAELVPCLADAGVERCWSGLRPGSPDGLPYLGRVPGTENLYIAAGHFRSGLQMSPGTAVLLGQLILGQDPGISLEGLACDRHQNESKPAKNPAHV